MARGDPLDGPVLVLAAAKASVTPQHLPELVDRAQAHLGPRLAEYRRDYECVAEESNRVVFLVERDHWRGVGAELGLDEREADALRRAHEEQLRRLGTVTDRREEFESALDIREAVVVGT
jgi:hypothetical protein